MLKLKKQAELTRQQRKRMFQDNRILGLGPGSGSFLDQEIKVDQ